MARSFHIDKHPLPNLDPSGRARVHINAEIGPLSKPNKGHILLPDWAENLGKNQLLKRGAKVSCGLGMVLDAYDIASSDPSDRKRAIGGAIGGGVGTVVGAAIGSSFMPGLGTWIGGAVGGMIGSAVGQWLGDR